MTRIQVRRGTAAAWTSANPVLASGEPALETDTGRRKIGDGVTAWTSLGYQFDNTAAAGTYRSWKVVTPTGGADDTPTLLAAIQTAMTANASGQPSQGVTAPPGSVFTLATSLNLSTLMTTGLTASTIRSLVLDFRGCTFKVANSLTGSNAIVLQPPSGFQFFGGCHFHFGRLIGGTGTGMNGLLICPGVNDTTIELDEIDSFTATGLLADVTVNAVTYGIFNNRIHVRKLTNCGGNGFQSSGRAMPSIYGFQGNQVHLGQVASNAVGVAVDGNADNANSSENQFYLGVVENNTYGVSDHNGRNTYILTSNSNSGAGFYLSANAQGAPNITGTISDTISLNGKPARIRNTGETVEDGTVASTGNQTYNSASVIDVPGLTKTVTSPGPHAAWLVTVGLDLQATGTSGQTGIFVGQLYADGVANAAQILAEMTAPTSERMAISKAYYVTGLAAGSRVIKVSGSVSGTGTFGVYTPHSTMTVVRVT